MSPQTETEKDIEDRLVEQLSELGWEKVVLPNDHALLTNLKSNLEALNRIEFSDAEFNMVLNHMGKGNNYDIANRILFPIQLPRKTGTQYVYLVDSEISDRNRFQVTSQVTQIDEWKSRYDVTLLVNGVPLIHIELKRPTVELSAAYRQIWDYVENSYDAGRGLYKHVKIFVISNDNSTRYFANEYKSRNLKQTFYWTDEYNTPVSRLSEFADAFLAPTYVLDTVSNYMVFHDGYKKTMVLRPYQRFAVSKILDCINRNTGNGYIWHTTGSGKTLTSFKAAQNIVKHTEVRKVLFVVDRADLDYQTVREFRVYGKGSQDGTQSAHALVKKLNDASSNLIVTTIQKLNLAVSKDGYMSESSGIRDDKVVLIFDECHRSQFGEMHANILRFFKNAQIFGFTGTPIFPENATRCMTTEDRFGRLLHRYSVTEAIRDQNVLPFSVDYYGDSIDRTTSGNVSASKDILENESRIRKIAKHVISIHDRKTHHRKYNAIMCVSSTAAASAYYDVFRRMKEKGEHDLNIATIYTFSEEEDVDDGAMFVPDDTDGHFSSKEKSKRDRLQSHVNDYNQFYHTDHGIHDRISFSKYGNDISDRMKMRDERSRNYIDKGIDILIVVNMFLTGFDARGVNTLYVDKNLQFHGLLQAFSRTNRTYEKSKSHGNIVCFRDLKSRVDEAITLFSRSSDLSYSLIESFEDISSRFESSMKQVLELAGTPDMVDLLLDEDKRMEFVRRFREVIRNINVLKTFKNFSFENLTIDQKTYADYTSKYLDMYRYFSGNTGATGGANVDDIDFELELIRRDEINVQYIVKLLAGIAEIQTQDAEAARQKMKEVKRLIEFEPSLSGSAYLFKDFIKNYLPELTEKGETVNSFHIFLLHKRKEKINQISNIYGIDSDRLESLLDVYSIRKEGPLRSEVENSFVDRPGVMMLKEKVDRVMDELRDFIMVFGLSAQDKDDSS